MRFARFAIGSTIGYGIVTDDGIRAMTTTPFLPWQETDEVFDPVDVRLLAPVLPSKVVAVGLNYADHAAERNKPLPSEPLLFLKPSTSVIGHRETILLPPQSERVDHEAELAVVIGRAARDLDPDEAGEAILGYTCANDVTARDLQDRDVQFTRAKGFDTFCPLGPHIVTDVDPSSLEISCLVNGAVRQSSNTKELIFPPAVLVSYVSSVMTLLPGDVILTGTPAGIGPLGDGDTVTVEVSGVGALENRVASR
ncbi:MAG TPA: fumarylacetoacetate hydrolase family protein [Actinomycetota bacterium]|nr:fumarylacetoacetate hydrolase family protein [Actinomycetota bacterium]